LSYSIQLAEIETFFAEEVVKQSMPSLFQRQLNGMSRRLVVLDQQNAHAFSLAACTNGMLTAGWLRV